MIDTRTMKHVEELWDRLDNLEGCEDNPVYAQEIAEIRRELRVIGQWDAATDH